MSIDETALSTFEAVPAVTILEERITNILANARNIKSNNTIEPPLPATDVIPQLKVLDLTPEELAEINAEPLIIVTEPTPSTTSPADAHPFLETAVRNVIYSLIAKVSIMQPDFADVWNLLDVCNIAADEGYLQAGISLSLIEELLDSQTIDGCRRVFDYVESRREKLVPIVSADDTKNSSKAAKDTIISNRLQVVLRTCNELLRRLSRAEDAVFCGRVFIFLFQSFPLGHKSSVNLRGEFHTDNVTMFDDGSPLELSNPDQMEIDQADKEEIKDGSDARPEHATAVKKSAETYSENNTIKSKVENGKDTDSLYRIFWSLQHIFSNPTRVFDQAAFDSFKNGLALTIKKFKSTKVVQTHSRAPADGPRGLKRKRTRSEDEFASNFNPKYLTSRDLFELEMSDLTFQRHILVQALITIDFLLSLTPRAKKKLPTTNLKKDLLFPYTLQSADEKWATETRVMISSYLQDGPDGKFYYRMADTVLSRDKNWVRWKVESCPSIVFDPVPSTSQAEAMNSMKRICTNRRIKANAMGGIDLSFVSDTLNGNGLEWFKHQPNVRAPDPAQCIRDVEAIDLDLEIATPEEKTYLEEGRVTATWKCFRIAARKRFVVLDKMDERDGLVSLIKDEVVVTPAAKKEAKEEEAADVKFDGDEVTVTIVDGQTANSNVIEVGHAAGSKLDTIRDEMKADEVKGDGRDAPEELPSTTAEDKQQNLTDELQQAEPIPTTTEVETEENITTEIPLEERQKRTEDIIEEDESVPVPILDDTGTPLQISEDASTVPPPLFDNTKEMVEVEPVEAAAAGYNGHSAIIEAGPPQDNQQKANLETITPD